MVRPGWYDDPYGQGERYWDGHQWAPDTRPKRGVSIPLILIAVLGTAALVVAGFLFIPPLLDGPAQPTVVPTRTPTMSTPPASSPSPVLSPSPSPSATPDPTPTASPAPQPGSSIELSPALLETCTNATWGQLAAGPGGELAADGLALTLPSTDWGNGPVPLWLSNAASSSRAVLAGWASVLMLGTISIDDGFSADPVVAGQEVAACLAVAETQFAPGSTWEYVDGAPTTLGTAPVELVRSAVWLPEPQLHDGVSVPGDEVTVVLREIEGGYQVAVSIATIGDAANAAEIDGALRTLTVG